MQERLETEPDRMKIRRETVEHPFGAIKFWMRHTHFQTKGKDNVATEMSLHVLAYNLKRCMNILGVKGLLEAMRAKWRYLISVITLIGAFVVSCWRRLIIKQKINPISTINFKAV